MTLVREEQTPRGIDGQKGNTYTTQTRCRSPSKHGRKLHQVSSKTQLERSPTSEEDLPHHRPQSQVPAHQTPCRIENCVCSHRTAEAERPTQSKSRIAPAFERPATYLLVPRVCGAGGGETEHTDRVSMIAEQASVDGEDAL